ncbi:hypothetical protein ACUH94_03715 [Dermabacteraceae bacterium P7074]
MPSLNGPGKPGIGSHRQNSGGKLPDTGRRSWHRRAGRPVSFWLFALILTGIATAFGWVNDTRWLLIHMVTLGLVSTSIMVWGQHFTEALLKTPLAAQTRTSQVRRIQLLTVSTLITCAGMLLYLPYLTAFGAVGAGGALAWYAAALSAQVRAALPARFTMVVRFYIAAACLMPVGALFGAVLAFPQAGPWHGRLVVAHMAVNILGFVVITAIGTLVTLWPTVLRTPLLQGDEYRTRYVLYLLLAAVAVIVATSLTGWPLGVAAGAFVYACGLLFFLALMVRTAWVRPPHSFAALSMASAMVWLTGCTLMLAVFAVTSTDMALLGYQARSLTLPLVGGFLLQLLFGAMSYLMPVVMGGGPKVAKVTFAAMDRAPRLRVALASLALGLILFSPASLPILSWAGVLLGGGLVIFFVFGMLDMVRCFVREKRLLDAQES